MLLQYKAPELERIPMNEYESVTLIVTEEVSPSYSAEPSLVPLLSPYKDAGLS